MCQGPMQQDETVGQVTLVGASSVGKYALVTRLLDPEQALSKQSSATQLWHLDTKYYTAQVHVHRSHPSNEARQQASSSQGLVLVFDATLEASFSSVSSWAEQLPESVADIRLCVANKADLLPQQQHASGQSPVLQRSSWLQEASTWCAENQFEYIEVSSTDRQLDGALVYDEQSQGVARVRQALEANYWPGLEMKEPAHAQAAQQDTTVNGVQSSTSNGVRQLNGNAANSSGELEAELTAFSPFQSAEEAELDQYESMFGELRATRERIQDLPRDQRQTAAADMALRIAAVLGLDEESDSSEDAL